MNPIIEQLLIDPVVVAVADCPGLKVDYVCGDFDFGSVRGHIDGPIDQVLRFLNPYYVEDSRDDTRLC